MNGQKQRSGGKVRLGFEGGQMPLYRRLPKRGFTNVFATEYETVNVDKLARFEAGTVVTPEMMKETGLVKKYRDGVKILGNGELKVALTVQANKFTKSAIEKIDAPKYSYWKSVWRVFFRKKSNIVIIILTLIILVFTYIYPMFSGERLRGTEIPCRGPVWKRSS